MDINSTSNICTVYDTFDFSKFILTHPESLQGGSFFTKLNINNDILYVQTPKCISKQGVVSSSGKKSYIDLMFSADDSNFIEFMENLEKSCVEKIHEKKNSWFTNDIDQTDIENAFTATLRPYKAGKYYLLRANIAPSKNLVKMPTCFVFDESENKLTLDDIKHENDLITVLEIQGIKFTSKSFQFEIILRQALIMSNKPVFQSCVIKKNIQHSSNAPSAPAPVPAPAQEHTAISSVSQTIHANLDNDVPRLQEQTQELLQHIEPHTLTENNLEKILNAKSDINFNLENQDDIDNGDDSEVEGNANSNGNANGSGEGDDYTANDNQKDVDIADDKIKSDTIEDGNSDSKNTNNTVFKNNSLSESQIKNGSNNLEKIESLELNELTELTEADLEIKNDENIKLKKPNDIYYEIYSVAKEKARMARKLAFDAYLEVKKIKKTYMLDDSDSDFSNSSSSDSEDESESESDSY
jgi:hypothetical protein